MDPRLRKFVDEVAEMVAYNASEMLSHADEKVPFELSEEYHNQLVEVLKNSKVLERYVLLALQQENYFNNGDDPQVLLDMLTLDNLDWFRDTFFSEFDTVFETELVREIAKKYPVDKTGLVYFLTNMYNAANRELLMYEYQKARRNAQKSFNKGSQITFKLCR